MEYLSDQSVTIDNVPHVVGSIDYDSLDQATIQNLLKANSPDWIQIKQLIQSNKDLVRKQFD